MGELKVETLLCGVSSKHQIRFFFELLHLLTTPVLVEVSIDLCDIMVSKHLIPEVFERIRILGEDQNLLVWIFLQNAINKLPKKAGLRVRLDVLSLLP